jgi:ribosomal protein L12E/L44/L45/RPP1/RPP2
VGVCACGVASTPLHLQAFIKDPSAFAAASAPAAGGGGGGGAAAPSAKVEEKKEEEDVDLGAGSMFGGGDGY